MSTALPIREDPRMRDCLALQPTGDKHLGNLIGGFRQYAATQERGDGFFCIVDLHSITTDYDPTDLRRASLDPSRPSLATGLDRSGRRCSRRATSPRTPSRVALLASRATASSDGAEFEAESEQREFVRRRALHLPGPDGGRHPALPARHRPIGDDRARLELARDLAERFDARFGERLVDRLRDRDLPHRRGRRHARRRHLR